MNRSCARAAARHATRISALELVAASGGEAPEATPLDEFVEAFIEHDPGRALAVVAHAVQQGRDPRTLTEEIIRHLRDCFLALMAPELVQLPVQREAEVSSQAPSASARHRSCGRWSVSARCWSRCATLPTSDCCSKSRWCNSPTTPPAPTCTA